MRRIPLTVREWKHLSGWYHNGFSVKWNTGLWVFIVAHSTNFPLRPKRRWEQYMRERESFYFISWHVSFIRDYKHCSGSLLFRQQLKQKDYCKKSEGNTSWCLWTTPLATGILIMCFFLCAVWDTFSLSALSFLGAAEAQELKQSPTNHGTDSPFPAPYVKKS